MKKTFRAAVTREGNWYVAHCLEVDVAGRGRTGANALPNLGESLALHFEPPRATGTPSIRPVEVEVGAT